jgi:hypothetical protein
MQTVETTQFGAIRRPGGPPDFDDFVDRILVLNLDQMQAVETAQLGALIRSGRPPDPLLEAIPQVI